MQVDQAVFAGRSSEHVLQLILDGALRIGAYRGGLLLLEAEGGPRAWRRPAGTPASGPAPRPPTLLAARTTRRLTPAEVARLAADSGITLPRLRDVPGAGGHHRRARGDPGPARSQRRLHGRPAMEAYASRAAVAYFHSTRETPPPA